MTGSSVHGHCRRANRIPILEGLSPHCFVPDKILVVEGLLYSIAIIIDSFLGEPSRRGVNLGRSIGYGG